MNTEELEEQEIFIIGNEDLIPMTEEKVSNETIAINAFTPFVKTNEEGVESNGDKVKMNVAMLDALGE